MKKLFQKLTASFVSALMLCSGTYVTTEAADVTDSGLKGWHIYGNVDDNEIIDICDAVLVSQFMTVYKNKHGNNHISVEAALAYREEALEDDSIEYYLPIPQAADIDGDGYITEADTICIQNYIANNYDKAKRCGQPFYININ